MMGYKSKNFFRFAAFPMILALLSIFPVQVSGWNHTEIEWRTLETDHFSIHFHEGEEWSARETARIAEEIHGALTKFYGFSPGRIHINLYDKWDKSAGATYYYLNRIDIDASDYDFALRGAADWLRNVITHEYTHMVTIQAAMKMPLWMPSIYLQGITFEKEKRPDVINGYPNFQGSLPYAGEIVPNWLAEGVAQFQCPCARNDIWDSHRDMILRMAVLNDRLLTLDEMGVFGKNSFDAEKLYNQGYSLVRFINESYGAEKLTELVKEHSGFLRLSFNGACRKVLGVDDSELYAEWVRKITKEYSAVRDEVSENRIEGERVAQHGFMNIFPLFAGKEGGYYYLSNRGRDYMGVDLVHQGTDGKCDIIARDVSSKPSLSKDRRQICYSKRSGDNKYQYELNDIFITYLGAGIERRLTKSDRVVDPVFSPDGKSIAAISGNDGSEHIVLIDVVGGSVRPLSRKRTAQRYYRLSWGDGGILATRFLGVSNDIVLIDPETGDETEIISTGADERDPAWDRSGAGFFYSSDKTGIFNIYYRSPAENKDLYVTNVLGGAFSPDSDGDDIVFSSFGTDGYEIRRIDGWRKSAAPASASEVYEDLITERDTYINRAKCSQGQVTDYDYSDLDRRLKDAKKYNVDYTPVYIFPRIVWYDDQLRLGVVADTRDYLDRQAVYGAASVNKDKEFNLQFGIESRQFKPTFFFNFYAARKYYNYFEEASGDVQVRYDLWDAFFGCRLELDQPSARDRKEIVLQYNHGEYGLNINAWDIADVELGWNYYKANEFSVYLNYSGIGSGISSDINPSSGRRFRLELTRAYDKMSSGSFEYNFKPIYDKNEFGRYTLVYEEFIPLPYWSHVLSLFIRGGAIDESKVDDFFNLFIGSRDGMRGYSYYSMGGRKNAMVRATYRFPVWNNINRQVLTTYFSSIYAGIFAEAGRAWDEDRFMTEDYKRDAGFELRLKGFNFYNYPLAASLEAAYGIDEIIYADPFRPDISISEGREWKFYGSVFFDF
ncbi:MAG: PD40 domain-containing protein [Candidatus Krumholzibacteriota bacterium]|nr:PD40 domain-containing protein [Candidatus Krumholzibacteriota bacterium]